MHTTSITSVELNVHSAKSHDYKRVANWGDNTKETIKTIEQKPK